jgi:histidyl-tRNA synthetase
MQKPTLPKGTRDFGPVQMAKRNFILDTIKETFRLFGYEQLETPAMENLSTLTGKYGDEGDQLLFKILNSGDFLKKVTPQDIQEGASATLSKVAEKGLRYDLTVPFARYVVMNRHELTFPFKRFQIQPVWRADRPQKGRYREFYQCDADVIGTDSLLCEAEIILMIRRVFEKLGIQDYSIKLNNRKVLTGIAEVIGEAGKEGPLCVAIDKLDKIGREKVEEELLERGFGPAAIQKLAPLFESKAESISEVLTFLEDFLQASEIGLQGIKELQEMLQLLNSLGADQEHLVLDFLLARGLSYYTGAIFEVKAHGVQIGSVSGGGRYDDLTGVFGMPNMSGVGFSFGVDRIYDVMEELGLFPDQTLTGSQVLLAHFDGKAFGYALGVLSKFRAQGIRAEVYPDLTKMKKQLDYASKKGIPFVAICGDDEIKNETIAFKNLETGEQESMKVEDAINRLI